MSVKEFFKPTLRKIILFLLIPIFYSQSGSINCLVGPCPQPYSFMPFIFAVFSYIRIYYQENLLPNLVFGIIGSYILASLIISFYTKLNVNFKDFIKPNIWKIIIGILILIFIFNVEFIRIQAFDFCETCNPDIYESAYTFLSRWINIFILVEALIVLSYLISCLILYAYNRIKVKK